MARPEEPCCWSVARGVVLGSQESPGERIQMGDQRGHAGDQSHHFELAGGDEAFETRHGAFRPHGGWVDSELASQGLKAVDLREFAIPAPPSIILHAAAVAQSVEQLIRNQ